MEIEIKKKEDIRRWLNDLGWYIDNAPTYFWQRDDGVIKLIFNGGESEDTFVGDVDQLDSWLDDVISEFRCPESSIYDIYGKIEGSDSVETPCPNVLGETMTRTAWKANCGAAGERIDCTCGFHDSCQFSSGCWQQGHNETYDWEHPNDPHHR